MNRSLNDILESFKDNNKKAEEELFKQLTDFIEQQKKELGIKIIDDEFIKNNDK